MGTKDLIDAKRKQEKLDLKYNDSFKPLNKVRKRFFFFNANYLITLTIISLTFFLYSNFFLDIKSGLNFVLPSSEAKVLLDDYKKETSMNIKKPVKIIDQETIQNTFSLKEEVRIDEEKNNLTTPDYLIENIEKTPGVFDQGRIYATVSQNVSEVGLKSVCKSIKQRFEEFDNLVICIYKNDEIGKNLAKGNSDFSSIRDQKKSWLALYTYNSVEGEYFDSNPNKYLGNY